jgi:hypothetical protein
MAITSKYLSELLLSADRFTILCEQANSVHPATGKFQGALKSCREIVDHLQTIYEDGKLEPTNLNALHNLLELSQNLFLALHGTKSFDTDSRARSFARYLKQTSEALYQQLR